MSSTGATRIAPDSRVTASLQRHGAVAYSTLDEPLLLAKGAVPWGAAAAPAEERRLPASTALCRSRRRRRCRSRSRSRHACAAAAISTGSSCCLRAAPTPRERDPCADCAVVESVRAVESAPRGGVVARSAARSPARSSARRPRPRTPRRVLTVLGAIGARSPVLRSSDRRRAATHYDRRTCAPRWHGAEASLRGTPRRSLSARGSARRADARGASSRVILRRRRASSPRTGSRVVPPHRRRRRSAAWPNARRALRAERAGARRVAARHRRDRRPLALFDRLADLGSAGRYQRFLDRGIAVVGPARQRPAALCGRLRRGGRGARRRALCGSRPAAGRGGPALPGPLAQAIARTTEAFQRPLREARKRALALRVQVETARRSCASTPMRSPRSNPTSPRSASDSRSRTATTARRCRIAVPCAGSTLRSRHGFRATATRPARATTARANAVLLVAAALDGRTAHGSARGQPVADGAVAHHLVPRSVSNRSPRPRR